MKEIWTVTANYSSCNGSNSINRYSLSARGDVMGVECDGA